MSSASKPMTYARLDETLADLGFKSKSAADCVIYEIPEKEAMIVLPLSDPNEKMSAWHLLTVRKTIIERNLATTQMLESRLMKPVSVSKKPRIERSTRISIE